MCRAQLVLPISVKSKGHELVNHLNHFMATTAAVVVVAAAAATTLTNEGANERTNEQVIDALYYIDRSDKHTDEKSRPLSYE